MELDFLSSRNLRRIAFCVVSMVSMSACAGVFGGGCARWKEQVLLHDGSVIIVERSVERGGRHEIGQQPPIKEQSLTFNIPGKNKSVTWKDGFSEDVGGANFLPMQLEINKDAAYLTAYPMGCLSYNKWGRPNPPYVVFRYKDKVWRRIELKELPEEFKTPNLIFSRPDYEAKKTGQSIVSVETIKNIYARYRQPEYKKIMRVVVGGGVVGCEVLVKYKCGWGAPGEFNRKYFESACD